jgi:membrane-associated phospholipid phosphatase
MNLKRQNILTVIIIFICLYHTFVQNKLEKTLFKTYLGYNNIVKRPLTRCKKYLDDDSIKCAGMPSGHAEVITIFSTLLYLYGIISLQFCIFLIFIVSLQRYLTNKHTIFQLIVGILFGYTYAIFYKFYDLSVYSFFIIFVTSCVMIYFISRSV